MEKARKKINPKIEWKWTKISTILNVNDLRETEKKANKVE